MSEELIVIPLGGLGEVGKNMMALEFDRQILVIDAGMMFPENDMLGIDLVIPDFRYLLDKKDQVLGMVLTHGHEDHIGALPYVLREIQAPIYATRLTRGLAELKLRRHRQFDQVEIHTIRDGDRVELGPFGIEFFAVTHSIPDGVGLAIDTPVGMVVHSGDFKFDYTPVDGQPADFARLARLGGRQVLALFSDSTNAENPGFTPSERVVTQALDQVFREAPGRIIVGTFASLISRIQQVFECARRHGRRVAIAGRTMVENVNMARDLGYLELGSEQMVSLDASMRLPPEQVVILATGTQGEPTAALVKMSMRRHRQVRIEPEDTVVMSSQIIPGNEEAVYRTINRLYQCGARVVYAPIAPVHVSGHASQEEHKLLLNLLRPRYLVPIHGELRHLHAHARVAYELGMPKENVLVVENGYRLHFGLERATIGERVPGGYVFVDGSGVGDVGPTLLRERGQLASDGFVVIAVALDAEGQLVDVPQIATRGFVFEPESGDLLDGVLERVIDLLSDPALDPHADVEELLIQEIGAYLYAETRRRPVIIPLLTR